MLFYPMLYRFKVLNLLNYFFTLTLWGPTERTCNIGYNQRSRLGYQNKNYFIVLGKLEPSLYRKNEIVETCLEKGRSNRQYVEKRSQCRKFWVVEMHPSDENEAMICSWEEKLRSRRHGCGWLGGPEVLLSFVMKWKPGEKMSRLRKATMLR